MGELIGGRYRLIRRLGEGGMAEVFLTELEGSRGFSRQGVIKRIHGQLAKASSVGCLRRGFLVE